MEDVNSINNIVSENVDLFIGIVFFLIKGSSLYNSMLLVLSVVWS